MRPLLPLISLPLLLLAGSPAMAANADLKITVTNGSDTAGTPLIRVRPAGHHEADVIASGGSNEDISVAAGTYDVEVSYDDGAAGKIIWFDHLALSGKVVKSVAMGLAVASLRVTILNNGKDSGDRKFEVRPRGQHDADVIVSGGSGDTVRLPAGTYSVDVRLTDGAVNKMVWLDGLSVSGAVQKTVEMGAPGADVTWHILNHGQDLGPDAFYEFRPQGSHNADVIVSAPSGQSIRVPPGTYNVDITYRTGLFAKTIWLDNQTIAGKVDRTTDMAFSLAHPTVTATLNGKDVGNVARIGIVLSGQESETGEI
jgi:hypothetical protein